MPNETCLSASQEENPQPLYFTLEDLEKIKDSLKSRLKQLSYTQIESEEKKAIEEALSIVNAKLIEIAHRNSTNELDEEHELAEYGHDDVFLGDDEAHHTNTTKSTFLGVTHSIQHS